MTSTKRGALVVLLALLLFIISISVSAEGEVGCYTYPGANEIDFYCQDITIEEAQANCNEHEEDCVFANVFTPRSSCNDVDNGEPAFPECRIVQCDVDCSFHGLGKCEWLGEQEAIDQDLNNPQQFKGEEVPEGGVCGQTCCRAGQFCSLLTNSWECELEGAKRGAVTQTEAPINGQCVAFCQLEFNPGIVHGCITSDADLEGVVITVEIGRAGQVILDENNCYERELAVGSFVVSASADGFATETGNAEILDGERTELNFDLISQEGAHVQFLVEDNEGNPLPGAVVRWREGRQQQTEFLPEGGPIIAEIPPGSYQFTAIKDGFTSQSISRDLREGDRLPLHTFVLSPLSPQGFSGITFIDELKGQGPEPQFGVEILVDGVPYYSRYPNAIFNIPLVSGDHSLSARFAGRNKIFALEQTTLTIPEGEFLENQELILTPALSDCGEGFPAVQVLNVQNVPGEAAFNLFWEIPCRDVDGYQITRIDGNGIPTILNPRGGREYRYQDNPDGGLRWGMEYSYEIIALYRDEGESEAFRVGSFNTGDQACQGKISSDRFCRVTGAGDDRHKIWSCNTLNQLNDVLCPENQFCAPLGESNAICKQAGICSAEQQRATPFGLYYEENSCYLFDDAGNAGTYCVYDYTDTIVNSCQSCADTIESCFDYQSEGACQINNCLSTTCNWVNATQGLNVFAGFERTLLLPTSFETGHGYCVQEEYQGTTQDPEADDYCNLCEGGSELFENYFCTGEVCGGLGRCFSERDLSQCNQCGDIPTPQRSCENYATELECVGDGDGLNINQDGSITLSDDTCGWGRCYWDNPGGQGSCLKDGNDDTVTDCEFREFLKGDRENGGVGFCRADNEAPVTSIEGNSRKITVDITNITFTVTDNNPAVREVHYCLSQLDADDCTNQEDYSLRSFPPEQRLLVNLASYIEDEMQLAIDGQTMALYYYSIDRYYNQEPRRSELFTVDIVPPEFDIGYEKNTTGVISSVQPYVTNQSESVECDFSLQQVDPPTGDGPHIISPSVFDPQEASFSNLAGRVYLLGVQCEDGNGNVRSEEEILYFDLEPRISIIYPEVQSVVRSQGIAFEVHTDAPALCRLERRDGQEIANGDFVPDEARREHITLPIRGFVEGEYFGTHEVVCRNLIDNEEFYDLFMFEIDYTGPESQIHLGEALRPPIVPVGTGWEVEFVESASATFTCNDDGFGCGEILYCLGEECQNQDNENYQEFSGVPVRIEEDTQICYFSRDEGGNEERPTKCGRVDISGHRLVLIQPEPYTFEGKIWGVSPLTLFNVEFMTEVTTQKCKFAFDVIDDYENIPAVQTLERLIPQDARYLIEGFPQGLARYSNEHDVLPTYITCENDLGEPGPDHIVYLEYDPTAPVITEAYAEPDLVTSGTKTILYVETDDKTVCRFEDASDGVTPDYALLSQSFPGFEEKELRTNHAVEYVFELLENKQDYVIAVQCQNGAGELSSPDNITFTADLTVEGRILSTAPSGRISQTDIQLEVITNKNAAFCEYRDGENFVRFRGEGTTLHTAPFKNVTEAEYIYPVRCMMAGSVVEDEIRFTIDRTAPLITEISDGNRTCGLDSLSAFIYTNEDFIGEYYYELHESALDGGAVLTTGSAEFGEPLTIGNVTLIANKTYFVRARVGDLAGNFGAFADSNGVLAVPENDSICEADVDAPEISPLINQSCSVTSVELHCDDDVGCQEITYGTSDAQESCVALNSYGGMALTVTQATWICYEAVDNSDNSINGSKLIPFLDEDGDGIANSCDSCPTTTPGRVVDTLGCEIGDISESERKRDSDGDGLPDSWEELYNSDICSLNSAVRDSDQNGISDFDEDYDEDGSTNYEEYLARTDPCLAQDAPVNYDDNFIDRDQERFESPISSSGIEDDTDTVAWALLIIGFVLTLGGIGYLVYYYKYSGNSSHPISPGLSLFGSKPTQTKAAPTDGWRSKLNFLRRDHDNKVKSQERESLFSSFESGGKPKQAPAKKQPVFNKLADIASGSKKRKATALKKKDDEVFSELKKIAKGKKKK
jgi:hypothetical protein